MKIYMLALVGVLCFAACKGDNSGAVKAHAVIKPGMSIWDAFDVAEQSQFPDIYFEAWGKECSHAGVRVGRHHGPRYLRVLRGDIWTPINAVNGGDSYIEEGFATREEFMKAIQANAHLFSACQKIVFIMGRYQGLSTDSFEVTLGPDARIKTLTPLEEIIS